MPQTRIPDQHVKSYKDSSDPNNPLDRGRLVGDGSHDRLVASVPEYATLWADYARSIETVEG